YRDGMNARAARARARAFQNFLEIMIKILNRLIALILIPCLLADPGTSQAFTGPLGIARTQRLDPSCRLQQRFQTEVIVAPVLDFARNPFARSRTVWLFASAALLLGAAQTYGGTRSGQWPMLEDFGFVLHGSALGVQHAPGWLRWFAAVPTWAWIVFGAAALLEAAAPIVRSMVRHSRSPRSSGPEVEPSRSWGEVSTRWGKWTFLQGFYDAFDVSFKKPRFAGTIFGQILLPVAVQSIAVVVG